MGAYLPKATLIIALQLASLLVSSAIAAEYSDDFIIPQVEVIVHTHDSFAIAMSPAKWGSMIPEHEAGTKYFVASRRDLEFAPITADEFSGLLSRSYVETNESRNCYRVVDGPGDCSEYTLPPERIEFIGLSVPVSLECNSRIADALVIQDDVWVLTFEQGGHGHYGAEGLLVLDTDGVEQARVDTGGFAPIAAVADRDSRIVWVVTEDRLFLMNTNHEILETYWPVHQFNSNTERPEVAIVSSEEGLLTDPHAVFAYTLGEETYAEYFEQIEDLDLARDQEQLYAYFMSGLNYRPSLPKQLNKLIPLARPTRAWHKFVCMLDDPEAEALCKLDTDKWSNADVSGNGKL